MSIKDLFSKIYVINLDRDKDRYEYVLSELKNKNSDLINHIQRFSAIDGRLINIASVDSSIITQTAKKDILNKKQRIYGVTMTYGSLGCALSHKKICEMCVEENNKPYLIFEDDIILYDNFDNHLLDLMNELEKIQYDIVYLGFHQIPHAKQTRINNVLSQPSGLICGTFGLILSPSGAQKILNIFPLNYQIDSSISHNLKNLKAYCHTLQIVQMNKSFKSNTQREYSTQNIYNKNDKNSSWNKLFDK